MVKSKKKKIIKRKRAGKYEKKLAIVGTLDDVLRVSVGKK